MSGQILAGAEKQPGAHERDQNAHYISQAQAGDEHLLGGDIEVAHLGDRETAALPGTVVTTPLGGGPDTTCNVTSKPRGDFVKSDTEGATSSSASSCWPKANNVIFLCKRSNKVARLKAGCQAVSPPAEEQQEADPVAKLTELLLQADRKSLLECASMTDDQVAAAFRNALAEAQACEDKKDSHMNQLDEEEKGSDWVRALAERWAGFRRVVEAKKTEHVALALTVQGGSAAITAVSGGAVAIISLYSGVLIGYVVYQRNQSDTWNLESLAGLVAWLWITTLTVVPASLFAFAAEAGNGKGAAKLGAAGVSILVAALWMLGWAFLWYRGREMPTVTNELHLRSIPPYLLLRLKMFSVIGECYNYCGFSFFPAVPWEAMEVPPFVPHPQKIMLAGFLDFGDVDVHFFAFVGAAAMVVLAFLLLALTRGTKDKAKELLVIQVFFDLLAFPLTKKLTSVFSCTSASVWINEDGSMKRVCTGSVPLDYHCMDESPHVTCWSSEHRVYIVAVLLLLMPYYLATLHLQASGQAQQSVVTINGGWSVVATQSKFMLAIVASSYGDCYPIVVVISVEMVVVVQLLMFMCGVDYSNVHSLNAVRFGGLLTAAADGAYAVFILWHYKDHPANAGRCSTPAGVARFGSGSETPESTLRLVQDYASFWGLIAMHVLTIGLGVVWYARRKHVWVSSYHTKDIKESDLNARLNSINSSIDATKVNYPVTKRRLEALGQIAQMPDWQSKNQDPFVFNLQCRHEPSGQQLEAATLNLVLECKWLRWPHKVRLCGVRFDQRSGLLVASEKLRTLQPNRKIACKCKRQQARRVHFTMEMSPPDGTAFEYLSDTARANQRFVLEVVKMDGLALQYVLGGLHEDPEIVSAAVENNGIALRYAAETLRANPTVVMAATKKNGKALQYASKDLQEDERFVLEAVAIDADALNYPSMPLKGNRDFVAKAVERNARVLEYVSDSFKNDKKIVLEAVKQEGATLQFASEQLKGREDIVLQAVKQDGTALQHASADIKGNKSVALKAIKNNPTSTKYISDVLKHQADFLQDVIDAGAGEYLDPKKTKKILRMKSGEKGARAREQLSVGFVLEGHPCSYYNGTYHNICEHQGWPVLENTEGENTEGLSTTFCYRHGNKWVLRNKHKPYSQECNTYILAENGPIPETPGTWQCGSTHNCLDNVVATVMRSLRADGAADPAETPFLPAYSENDLGIQTALEQASEVQLAELILPAVRGIRAARRIKHNHYARLNFGGLKARELTLNEHDPRRIVFVGCTGTGKSSLCTALTGQDKKTSVFKSGSGGKSETTESSMVEMHWLGDEDLPRFLCVDTPGLNDSEGQDAHHIADIVNKMKQLQYISAVVLVLSATDVRFTQSLQDMFRKFIDNFCGSEPGQNFYNNFIIAFQRWKVDADSVADRRDENITERSIAADINRQFREKFKIGRSTKEGFPCVFLNSHERDEKLFREGLLELKEKVPATVFLTKQLTHVVPQIVDYVASEQNLIQGVEVKPMKPVLTFNTTVLRYEITPPLPKGLQFCPHSGHITGTPRKFCAGRKHSVIAIGHGGPSNTPYNLAELEIKMPEKEIERRIMECERECTEQLTKVVESASAPKSVEEVGQIVQSIRDESDKFLETVRVQLSGSMLFGEGELTGMSQLPSLINGMKLQIGSITNRIATDFQTTHQVYISERATADLALQLKLQKAEWAVSRQLSACTEDYGELEASVNSLEALGIEDGSSEAETVTKAQEWLSQIAMCKCTNPGCPQMLMRKDQVAHTSTCLFGLSLLPHSAVKKTRGENFDDEVELLSNSTDEAIKTWAGVYECGECNFPVEDDDAGFYHLVNPGEQRLQRIKKQEDGHWVITAWTGEGEEEEVQFTSTNEAESFADANFKEFTKEPPVIYSWDAECTEKAELLEESVKMVFFTGHWCPYCPLLCAKLKKFFEVITQEFGSRALQIISVSSDRSEADMLEYYGGHHGTWYALPYHSPKKELIADKYPHGGIPSLFVVGNDSNAVEHFGEDGPYNIGDAIRSISGDADMVKQKALALYAELKEHTIGKSLAAEDRNRMETVEEK